MRLGIKGKQVLGVTTIVGAMVVVLSLMHLAQLAQVNLAPDAFVAGVGTGGTVMGVGAFLKSRHAATRVHPLEPDEASALRSYLRTRKDDLAPLFLSRNRRPISRAALDDIVRHYADLAGVPKDRRSFHVLKHSIATHLLDAGTRVETVRDWLGHKNIENTLVYAKLTNPTRDAEVGRALASRKVAR